MTKGAAIIMVVYYHATLYLQHQGVEGVLGRAKAAFELFPMPAFLLIAGLFSARIVSWTFADLWRRKLLPLIYLYVVWSVLRAAFYLVVPGLNGELGELPATNILSLALIFVWPSSSYWFVYALFLFTFALWAVRRLPALVVVIVAGIVSTLFTSGLVNAGNIGWNRVGALAVFFVAGALYAEPVFVAVQRSRPIHLIAAAAIFVAVSALVLFAGMRWLPFLVLVGQIAAVAFGVMLSKLLARVRPFGFLSYLGSRSLKIYLIHLFVIVSAAAIVGTLNPDWPRWLDFLVLVSVVLLAIFASLWIARATAAVRWLYLPPPWLTRGRSRATSALPAILPGVPTGPIRLHEEGKS
ncbi:acyltransferase family protein [Agromyces binzhouensis]|uniref:acyltransferase family protein n=1 Tax=Agromyces binzhouensis TaxID=1817495 RepID=UPI003624F701